MFILKKLVSAALLPPYSLFLLTLWGIWLMHRRQRAGRRVAVASLLALMLMSMPLVGKRLLRTLEDAAPLPAAAAPLRQSLASAQAIVVLGGGSYPAAVEYGGDTVNGYSLQRVRYAARLQRLTGLPLLVTGGAPFGGRPEAASMAEALEGEFAVKPRWVEMASRDTAENALYSAQLLRAAGITRVALVTHAWHLPRARELFVAQGLTVIAAPTGFANDSPSLLEDLLPHPAALTESSFALREWLGRLWNRR